MKEAAIRINKASGNVDMEYVRELFTEYRAEVDTELCFPGFEEELAELPGRYAAPLGRLLLAQKDAGTGGKEITGGVGVTYWKEPDTGIGEMRRLYVRPNRRGRGLGRRLAEAAIDGARDMGYSRLRLLTLERMTGALALYPKLGFSDISGDFPEAPDGLIFMERDL